MNSDDDGPLCDPDPDPRLAELLDDASHQPIPPRIRLLAEQLKKALAEARDRRDH